MPQESCLFLHSGSEAKDAEGTCKKEEIMKNNFFFLRRVGMIEERVLRIKN